MECIPGHPESWYIPRNMVQASKHRRIEGAPLERALEYPYNGPLRRSTCPALIIGTMSCVYRPATSMPCLALRAVLTQDGQGACVPRRRTGREEGPRADVWAMRCKRPSDNGARGCWDGKKGERRGRTSPYGVRRTWDHSAPMNSTMPSLSESGLSPWPWLPWPWP